LFDIWNFRAGLNNQQKNAIVPQYHQKLFKYSPFTVSNQAIGTIQKINMNAIRLLISSAADRNDRVLGAMYVVTAFTMVNRQARIAYPWLYESVEPTAQADTNADTGTGADVHALLENILAQANTNANANANSNAIIHPFEPFFGINWLQGLFFEPIPPLSLNAIAVQNNPAEPAEPAEQAEPAEPAEQSEPAESNTNAED
jgi:hypothetical protein